MYTIVAETDRTKTRMRWRAMPMDCTRERHKTRTRMLWGVSDSSRNGQTNEDSCRVYWIVAETDTKPRRGSGGVCWIVGETDTEDAVGCIGSSPLPPTKTREDRNAFYLSGVFDKIGFSRRTAKSPRRRRR